MVAFYHAVGMSPGHTGLAFGAAGVDIFFVISGFIMWTTTSGGQSAVVFAQHRIERVVPLYWIVTLAVIAPRLFQAAPSLPEVAHSLFFIPYVSPKTNAINPIVAVGWTLNFEMFFYLIFAFGLCLPRYLRLYFVPATLIVLVISGVAISPSNPIGKVYTSPLLLEFLLGCFIAIAIERTWLLKTPVAALALISGATMLLFTEYIAATDLGFDRFFFWGIPSAIAVYALVSVEHLFKSEFRFLSAIGNASYSIYLTHSTALVAMKFVFNAAPINPAVSVAYILTGVAASVLFGLAIFRIIERPTLQRCKRHAALTSHTGSLSFDAGSRSRLSKKFTTP